ncbi:lysine transporter LysE [Marinobacterium zhoushanense]|uniref:Lysine transporter LysE n=1 Tax=Marinobacterium zhoushanense TaxID=1679163 RepID=A0ABQ1K038_9GAMM|nr:LysE family translocator [Marinobacterium zhoushanense]GGB79427.1 lysine transporter LysE [Marinobacterium zhoushanense]
MLSTEFLLTSLVVVLIPGTGVLYTISTGLFLGLRASLFAAIGCTFGIFPSMLASILGLSVILHTSALAFQVVKFAGVAYLLYLAWGMWKHTSGLALTQGGQGRSMFDLAFKGFLINILNPKLTLFFLAFLPQFVPETTTTPMTHMLVLGLVFMGMTLGVFVLYGLLANGFRRHVLGSPRVAKYMQRSFAATFALLGAKLALAER